MGQVECWTIIRNCWTAMPGSQRYIIVGAGIAGLFTLERIYTLLKKSQHRKKWSSVENVVILHQSRRRTFADPFSLKLETYLRMADIRYQNDHEEQGKTLWITLNGTEISDCQLCLEFLADKFNKDLSAYLSIEKKAMARALGIMAEEHLYKIVLSWKWFYSKETVISRIRGRLLAVTYLPIPSLSKTLNSLAYIPEVERPTETQLIAMGIKNLRTISRYLGAKPYFMGDQPTEIDCTMFGILSQLVWNLPGSPFEWPLESEFLNLKRYCDRMKDLFWKDYQ